MTIALALTAAIASALLPSANLPTQAVPLVRHLVWPAAIVEGLMLIASICCFMVLWPGRWHAPGYQPNLVLNTPYGTELEVLEAMAGGYDEAVTRSAKGLSRLEKWLRAAWLCFIGSPIMGLLAYLLI